MNEQIKRHFRLYLWLYIVTLIFSIVLITHIFSLLSRVKETEKLSIFIAADDVAYSRLSEDFKLDTTKKIEVDYYDPNDNLFNKVLLTRGVNFTDIIILPVSLLDNIRIMSNFKILDYEVIKKYIEIEESDIFTYNGKLYGIPIYDGSNGYLDSYINYNNEPYVLLFNIDSKNIDDLNRKKEHNNALLWLKKVFEEKNV